MPEGPECAATARSLDEFMRDKTIVNIEVLSGRYLKKSPEGLIKEVQSELITGREKYLLNMEKEDNINT